MFYTIYRITNIINNKTYTGKHQTKDLNDGYMGSGKLISAAIKKYGIENFKKEILYVFDTEEEMNNKEKELVVVSEETYNLVEGGKGGFGYINKNGLAFGGDAKAASKKGNQVVIDKIRSDDNFREKYIQNYYQYLYPKRYCAKRFGSDNVFFGKKHTDEVKKIIGIKNSMHQTGPNNSNYGKCWITNGVENKSIKKEDLDIWLQKGYYKGRINGNKKNI